MIHFPTEAENLAWLRAARSISIQVCPQPHIGHECGEILPPLAHSFVVLWSNGLTCP